MSDDPIDDLLYGLQQADFVTPLMAFGQDLLHGQIIGGDFGVHSAGRKIGDIKNIVKRAKIDSWGWIMRRGDLVIFTVNHADAEETKALLIKQGLRIEYSPV